MEQQSILNRQDEEGEQQNEYQIVHDEQWEGTQLQQQSIVLSSVHIDNTEEDQEEIDRKYIRFSNPVR